MRHSSDGGSPAYRELIADFLAVHSFKQEHQGYPAFQGELIAEGAAMKAEHKLIVFVSAVLCEWPENAGIDAVSSLWFLVCDGAVADGFNSFAVGSELVIEAFERVDPSLQELQIPVPAVEARDLDADRVLAGESLCLRIGPTRIVPAPGTPEPRLPASGIRFVIGDDENEQEDPRTYSFAMAGLSPFLALDAVSEQCSSPSSFGLDLGELRQELERASEQ